MEEKTMKKLISAILLIVVFLNTFALIGVSAETTDKISFEEAERLSFEAARTLFRLIKNDYGYREVSVDFYKGYFLFRSTNYQYFDSYVECRSRNEKIEIEMDGGYDWSYYKVEQLAAPFNNITDLNNYLKTIYDDKAFETFIKEKIYVEHDGNIYWRYTGGDGWYGREHRLLLCNNFVSNSDGKAVMNVVFGEYGGPAEDFVYMGVIPSLNTSYAKQRELLVPVNATVEFIFKDDGFIMKSHSDFANGE